MFGQEYLMMNRPDFVNTAEHRRRCLDQLAYLRELRNKSRQKLLASAVSLINTDSSTGAPSTANLPPPPLCSMPTLYCHRYVICPGSMPTLYCHCYVLICPGSMPTLYSPHVNDT
uniref:Uncharacterized protein n=1 Tax=Timema monikensis TaxID=170555 RepID=A0A7R9E4N8_9NEOP|nr:unnamed protein product [Timema monikensis]